MGEGREGEQHQGERREAETRLCDRHAGDDRASGERTAGEETGRSVTRLTDPRALRAYAHPVRMKLVGLLRTRGPLTATQAARLIGESSGTCSFHFRQLAKYGLVEEAGGGTGREKPWRAIAMYTAWDDVQDTPEGTAAVSQLLQVAAETQVANLMRWLAAREAESAEWRTAAMLGDEYLWLTPAELTELGRQAEALTTRYADRLTRPELRPEGARPVSYLHIAFPHIPRDDAP